jgi:hypothetical protein
MTRKEEVEGKRQTKRKGTKAPKAGTGSSSRNCRWNKPAIFAGAKTKSLGN